MGKKEKIKNFMKEHKKELLDIGVATCGFVLGIAIGNNIFKKGYQKGFVGGGVWGFDYTIKWFDEKIPETKLVEVWTKYRQEHPDKIVAVKF